MSKTITKFMSLVLMIAGLSASLSAQTQIPVNIRVDIENRLADAANTTVTDANGRVIQIEILPVSGTTREVLHLGYDSSGLLSSVTDSRGVTVGIQRNGTGEVRGFIFPDGGTVDLGLRGCESLDTLNITRLDKTIDSILFSNGFDSYRPRPRGGSACRDAAWAAAVGLAICAASPGSVACWGATANAAYHALRCYESTQD